MTDDDIRWCPICIEQWTNLKEIDGKWYVYHWCDKAGAFIAWNERGAPLDISERLVQDPPRHIREGW